MVSLCVDLRLSSRFRIRNFLESRSAPQIHVATRVSRADYIPVRRESDGVKHRAFAGEGYKLTPTFQISDDNLVHGCLLAVFSVASAAAISSNEGTSHNDMYGSGLSQEPAARVRPSGENLSDRQVPGRVSSVATSCSVAMFQSFTLRS